MTDAIGVGLIGYGMAARVFHAPVIESVPQLRLKKIVERRTDEARARYPSVEVVRDASALWQDEAIQLVVVATPNDSHFDMARASLLANKHTIVEKPFTTTSEQARQLIELARRQNRLVSVNHNRRWDGDFLTVKRLLESKFLGRLVEYESRFDRFRNRPREGAWREAAGAGAGILFDLGSHLIDQTRVLFGTPRMLTADIRVQRGFGKADDYFELILHYDDLKATLKAGMLVREPTPRFVLRGTEGSFVKYGFDPQEAALKSGLAPGTPHWGEEARESWGRLDTQIGGLHVEGRIETEAGCYQDFYRNIADAIAGRAELAVKPEEARDTIRLIELAMQSNAERRTLAVSL